VSDLIASLLIAAVGALLTYGIALTKRRIDQRRLRRRYPVAGTFITEFEDRSDEQPTVQRAISKLSQKGTEIEGVTTDLSDSRSWRLSGQIDAGGFLHGIYAASDPHDTGVGTFFLEIDGNKGDMEGLWAGYDSTNRQVAGGRYSFRRCPEVEIRASTDRDASAVVALLGEALGDRYVELSEIRKLASGSGGSCHVAMTPSGEVVGASTASWIDRDDLPSHFPAGQEAVTERLSSLRYHERIGHLEAVAVAVSYQGRGLASRLVERAVQSLEEAGVTSVISFGWIDNDHCAIRGILEGQDFRTLLEVDRFWTEDSRAKGYSCPTCGDVCQCAAIIFTKPLAIRALPEQRSQSVITAGKRQTQRNLGRAR